MVSDKFLKCHAFTLKAEGGYSNNPNDSGGATKYGVSIVTLKDYARWYPAAMQTLGFPPVITEATIKNLTVEKAERFFYRFWWQKLSCEEIPTAVACCLYDFAVNSGHKRAVRKLQECYNNTVFTGHVLETDGIVGPKTIAACQKCNTEDFITEYIDVRRSFFRAIVRSKPSQKVFLKGWLNRCDNLYYFAVALL